MGTVQWDIGRTITLPILSGKTESDVLDLGAVKRVVGTGVVAAEATTTSIPTSSLSPSGANDHYQGTIVVFRSNTTTAALRNQQRAITGSNSDGVLTVIALTDAPAEGDVFDILYVLQPKAYRRWDITILNEAAALTGTVTVMISNTDVSPGNFATLQSGGADVTLPVLRATALIPLVARFLKLKSSGAEAADRTFIVMAEAISIER